MKLPPLNALRAFECAARTGSFATAGRELGVTSAAVSQQVRNLEGWIGRTLFQRRANRIWLTDAGRDYYMNAAAALTEIASFTQALSEGDARRALVISASPALAQLWLPRRLARFANLRPDVPLHLRIDDDSVDLEQSGIDARLTYGGEHPEYHTTPLFTDALIPVAAKADACPATTRLITVNWGATISSVPGWSQWFAAADLTPDDGTLSDFVAPSVPAALALAIAGLGVALLPGQIIADALATGQLHRLDGPSLAMSRPYVMITAHYKARSRRLGDLARVLGG